MGFVARCALRPNLYATMWLFFPYFFVPSSFGLSRFVFLGSRRSKERDPYIIAFFCLGRSSLPLFSCLYIYGEKEGSGEMEDGVRGRGGKIKEKLEEEEKCETGGRGEGAGGRKSSRREQGYSTF